MIGAVGPTDLWQLRRVPTRAQILATEQLLAARHRPTWFGVRSLIPFERGSRLTLSIRDRSGTAWLQSQQRRGRPEQDIVYLASARAPGSIPGDHERWFQLLQYLPAVLSAAVERLYAALPRDSSELHEIFRQAGFRVYTQQLILQRRADAAEPTAAGDGLLPQTRRDLWFIQQLYGRVTPAPVQAAESRTARSWELGRWTGQRAWLRFEQEQAIGRLHIQSGDAAHVLSVIAATERSGLAGELLRAGLLQIRDSRPVLLTVRVYQQELVSAAEQLGFELIGAQDLLVRQTAQTIRRPVFATAMKNSLNARLHLQR
jgi:hypothetical protein